MQTTTLGDTGLTVTRIGLGLAALGRPGYINLGHADDLNANYEVAAMEQQAHMVLSAAWEAGVRYFDAARSYGRAEEFLGSWLMARGFALEDVTVGSKWGYTYTADWQVEAEKHEVKEHSLAVLQRQWGETQANLGAHLDLYQVHSATLSSGILDNAEVLTELARLKSEGTAIGLSLSGDKQGETLQRAMAVRVDGVRVFDAVQATWNLLERSAGEALAEAHNAGMGVIIKEAVANGRLTARNSELAVVNPMRAQAERLETTIDALAMAAVLAQPWCDIVLSGAATVEHLRSNVVAENVAWDDDAASALADLAEDPAQYWQTRGNLAWN